MAEVFLDTSFAIAVTVATDRYHQTALRLARELRSSRRCSSLLTPSSPRLEIPFHDHLIGRPQRNFFARCNAIPAFLSSRSTRSSSREAISCSSTGQIRPGASPIAFRLRSCRNETFARPLLPTNTSNRRGLSPSCARHRIDRTWSRELRLASSHPWLIRAHRIRLEHIARHRPRSRS